MIPVYNVGDIVQMRKPHACGGDEWEIMRTGMDFRIRCRKCGRVVLIPRRRFERSVKTVLQKGI
ncbi:MAG: DUF951 domain-containing protein [Firmicutes bacterium]|nr:DUF951 domain-containing protein [Bacillota bacterium]